MPELRGGVAIAACRLGSVTQVLRLHRVSELPVHPGMQVTPRVCRFAENTLRTTPRIPLATLSCHLATRVQDITSPPTASSQHICRYLPTSVEYLSTFVERSPHIRLAFAVYLSHDSIFRTFFRIVRQTPGANTPESNFQAQNHAKNALRGTCEARYVSRFEIPLRNRNRDTSYIPPATCSAAYSPRLSKQRLSWNQQDGGNGGT